MTAQMPRCRTIDEVEALLPAFGDWARLKGIEADIADEYERFTDWHLANGRRRADYAAAFRNWLRGAGAKHDHGAGARQRQTERFLKGGSDA